MKKNKRGFLCKCIFLRAAAVVLAVALCGLCGLCGCSKGKNVKNITEKKGQLSATSANYDFVETPGDNKNQPEVPEIQLPAAAEYFTRQVDENVLGVYKQLYSGVLSLKENIDITDKIINKDDISGLLELCTATSPEISYINQNYTVSLDDEDYVTAVTVKYGKTKSDINREKAQLENRISEILSGVSTEWGEYEKVKYFHDTIIQNCEYSETSSNAYSAYGCLCEGKAVCEGYTKAMLLLCEKENIRCIPVVGKGVSSESWQPHMWNKIMINGNWYNFDLTWDDPISDFEESYVRYDYFGLDDDRMNKDHIPDEKKYMVFPKASSFNADYFMRNNLYCDETTDKYTFVSSAVDSALQRGEMYVRMKCSDTDVFNGILEEFFSEEKENPLIFSVLESCGVTRKGYSSTGYSLIKNPVTLTITVRLNYI